MAEAIADELVKAPSCSRIVFETGRMATILFHGLRELGFSVAAGLPGAQVAFYPQDRPQRRARFGAFGWHWLLQAGACEVLSAHAVRSLIIARKKLVGQRVTLEDQIRGLAVVFGGRPVSSRPCGD